MGQAHLVNISPDRVRKEPVGLVPGNLAVNGQYKDQADGGNDGHESGKPQGYLKLDRHACPGFPWPCGYPFHASSFSIQPVPHTVRMSFFSSPLSIFLRR